MLYVILVLIFVSVRLLTLKFSDVFLKINPYITSLLITLFLLVYFLIYKVLLNIESDNSFIILIIISFSFLGNLFTERYKLYWKKIGK